MAGFQTAAMPRPQSRARPATPVVDIALVRPQTLPLPTKGKSALRWMTVDEKAHACRLVSDGVAIEAVAAEIGFSATTIRKATKGIERRGRAAAIEAKRSAREEMRAEIRHLRKLGFSYGKIADRLNTSRRNVRVLDVSAEEYKRYLALKRKQSKAKHREARKANRGLKKNFLEPTARAIKAATGIGIDELKSIDFDVERPPALVRARQILCWLAVTRRKIKPTRVGRELGIDHSTVLNAVRAVQAIADTVDLPRSHRVNLSVAALMGAMQSADTERRRAIARRSTEIPTP
jgi:DNA-binding transcriptional MerR regulator